MDPASKRRRLRRPSLFAASACRSVSSRTLPCAGVSIVARRAFRDHHPFSEQDLRDLARAAEKAEVDAVVITTKDAVRIQTWPSTLPLLVMAARLDIEDLPRVLKRIDRVILARIRAGL
jgi:tetraacyldisaccharide-1-P 4'-kinase